MDFEEDTKRMRLKSLHAGVALDDVIARTGFDLVIPERIGQTEPPTAAELQILRRKADRCERTTRAATPTSWSSTSSA